MAKDPAFLFYSSDFLTGTTFMTNEQVGKYIKLLCLQHQHGHLTENQMKTICSDNDELIWSKFSKLKDGKYHNIRLHEEIIKRQAYSKSRSDNRLGKKKKKKHMNIICKTYDKHMENENENEDKDITINKKNKYGEYKNILLTNIEYNKLIDKFGDSGCKHWIKTLDEGIEQHGYKYKSHYLTILKWHSKEPKQPKKEEFTCM